MGYITPTLIEKSSASLENKIIIYTGLALFAMFFGAANIVFPLYIGANCGDNIVASLLGFLLAGVGVPFLGLIAVSLYQGDYFAFFARLGKIPAWIIIALLMIVLGPLGAMPRTETTTFNTLLPFLPEFLKNNAVFSLLYFGLVTLLAYREAKIVKILGLFLSPIKIISFSFLVIIGLMFTDNTPLSSMTSLNAFQQAVSLGYNTMDLLAGILFCTTAFRSIQLATREDASLNPGRLTLKACALGAIIISIVYTGFMLVAYKHAGDLQSLGAEQTISAISFSVLGKFGGLFVCILVSFACIATTLALGQACNQCLYHDILKGAVPKQVCFGLIIFTTYLISNLGFQGILEITSPIVNIIYPALIVHCLFSILYLWKGIKIVKTPVFFTLILTLVYYIVKWYF